MDIKLRIQGSIIGLLTGDAIGHEFNKQNHQAASKSTLDQLTAQSYTDVSSMSLCTMSSINEIGEIDDQDIAYSINEWYIGGFLGSSFNNDRTTISQSIRKHGNGMPPDRCGSTDLLCDNSALIRMLPISLFLANSPISELINSTQLITNFTNKQTLAEVCSVIYCLILRNLLLQKKEGAFQLLRDHYEAKGKKEHISSLAMLKNKQNNDKQGTQEVADSFWSSWKSYSEHEEDFEKTIRAALSFGNNANATAAIAGSLSGANLGNTAVPQKWIKQLNLSEEAKGVIRTFSQNISKRLDV